MNQGLTEQEVIQMDQELVALLILAILSLFMKASHDL
jgi:hypothetical protein